MDNCFQYSVAGREHELTTTMIWAIRARSLPWDSSVAVASLSVRWYDHRHMIILASALSPEDAMKSLASVAAHRFPTSNPILLHLEVYRCQCRRRPLSAGQPVFRHIPLSLLITTALKEQRLLISRDLE